MLPLAIGVGGLILSAVGIGIALKSIEKKKPKFCGVTYAKIAMSSDAPGDIEIRYKGAKVNRIASTFLWLWNDGRRPIRSEDIPEGQSIRVHMKDGTSVPTILDAAVRKASRDAIDFSIRREGETELIVMFDFLDFRDGGVIEVQHTGGPGTAGAVSGVVLGAPDGFKRVPLVPPGNRRVVLPTLGSAYQQSARRSRRRQFLLTLLWAAICGTPVYAMRRFGVPVKSLTPDMVQSVLQHLMAPSQVDSAMAAIRATLPDPFGFWIATGMCALFLVIALLVIWSRPYAFPDSLLLGEPATER